MAFSRTKFEGCIDGNFLYNYRGRLKGDFNTLEERIELVNDILSINNGFTEDKFWQDVWDLGICKTNVGQGETLWSDTNVCKMLEGMANYILHKAPKEKRETIRIYDDYKLFKRALDDQKLLKKHGEIVEYDEEDKPVIMFIDKNRNFKKDKKAVLKASDTKHEEISEYEKYKTYLDSLVYTKDKTQKDKEFKKEAKKKRELLAKKIDIDTKEGFTVKEPGDVYRVVRSIIPRVKDDMINVKVMKEKPIVWKSPLRDSGNEIDWDYLDMFDPEHVKLLLQVNKEIDASNEVLISIEDLILNTDLSDVQRDILYMWRKDMTQQNIADSLGMKQSNVNTQLNKIIKKIIDTYEKKYEEEYYYLNVVKGKYKKCSKCGEIKLLQRFDKNGKKGYRSSCKQCK